MDDRLTPSLNDRVEDALRSYPVLSMPRDITAGVMVRIQATPAPRFRLTRNDILLAVVLTVVFSALFFSLQFLPGHIVLHLRIQVILLWQRFLVNARWLLPALLFGSAAVLAALTIPSLYQMTINSRSR